MLINDKNIIHIEQKFLEELNIFRNEVDSVLKFFYSELAIHSIASKDKKIINALNSSPIFWNTVLSSLQNSTFITLGRIFDTDPNNHTIHTLFKIAEQNKELFSREAFSGRWKRDQDKNSKKLTDYLPTYLKGLYVPNDDDFRGLRRFISNQKRIYETVYGPIRHHFGHKKYTKDEDVKVFFDKVQVSDLEKYCVQLKGVHETLWQLFHNGRGPLLPIKQGRYSTRSILKNGYKPYVSKPINAKVIDDTLTVLTFIKSGHLCERGKMKHLKK